MNQMHTPIKLASDAPSGNDADTNGWDTVFAIDFQNANKAVLANWAQVSDKAKNMVQAASDDPSYNVNAVLGPWQLTEGGDGKNVRMLCPVASGKYVAGSTTYDLGAADAYFVIEVGMEWVPNPDQFAFVISNNGEVNGITAALDGNRLSDALRAEFVSHGKTLSASASALLQKKGLEWLITDGKDSYYIFKQQDKDNDEFLNVYQFQSSWANNLKLLGKAVSDTEPAVAVITIGNNPASGIAAAVLPELVSVWFNSNIGEFNHVFASLDLSPAVAKSGKYAWMKPTATSYAVTDQGSLDTSIFGVLTMATNNPVVGSHQVSPFAIPAGADAGFLISGPMFMKNMLLGGAQAVFNGAPADAFVITNDGLTIQNAQDMIWGKFMMDNKKQGSIAAANFAAELDAGTLSATLSNVLENQIGIFVYNGNYRVEVTDKGSQWLLTQGKVDTDEYILSLNGSNIDVYLATAITIAKGQFKMSLVHSYVEIQFVDLYYAYSGDFDVHVNYTEQVQLKLKDENGKKIFWFDEILRNLVVNVTKTKSAITREIVEGAITGALALVAVAGPIIEGLSAGAEVSEVTENAGSAIVDSETFSSVAEENSSLAAEDEAASGSSAAEQSGGKLTNIKNAFGTPKWKFVASLAGLSGAVAGFDTAIDAIIEAAAKDEWEKVPGFDLFAEQAIAPYTFPNVSGFTLASAQLAGSLQLGLKINS